MLAETGRKVARIRVCVLRLRQRSAVGTCVGMIYPHVPWPFLVCGGETCGMAVKVLSPIFNLVF